MSQVTTQAHLLANFINPKSIVLMRMKLMRQSLIVKNYIPTVLFLKIKVCI